jgi:hypothetical protein
MNTILVSGYREFNDYNAFKIEMDLFITEYKLKSLNNLIILHGGARGTDTLAHKYAKENNYQVISQPADWSLGKSAGVIRNQSMIDTFKPKYGICFVHFLSKGTKDCLQRMRKSKNNMIIKEITLL